jgi:hypothetical protein
MLHHHNREMDEQWQHNNINKAQMTTTTRTTTTGTMTTTTRGLAQGKEGSSRWRQRGSRHVRVSSPWYVFFFLSFYCTKIYILLQTLCTPQRRQMGYASQAPGPGPTSTVYPSFTTTVNMSTRPTVVKITTTTFKFTTHRQQFATNDDDPDDGVALVCFFCY